MAGFFMRFQLLRASHVSKAAPQLLHCKTVNPAVSATFNKSMKLYAKEL
jgi:hypothetical protein